MKKLRTSAHSSLSFLILLRSTTAIILMSMMLNFVLLLTFPTGSSGQLIHNNLLEIFLALDGKFLVYSLCPIRQEPSKCTFSQSKENVTSWRQSRFFFFPFKYILTVYFISLFNLVFVFLKQICNKMNWRIMKTQLLYLEKRLRKIFLTLKLEIVEFIKYFCSWWNHQ